MAKIIDGKEIAKTLQKNVAERVSGGMAPGLVIIQVGGREDSNVYIRMKMRAAEACGIKAKHINLSNTTTERQLLNAVEECNRDPNVHGMIVQLPLDTSAKIDTDRIVSAVDPRKDVDGLHPINAGKLSRGELASAVIPCTPAGCLELIKHTGVDLVGKTAVVVGRSKIVGSPMADLLKWSHCTVTMCHSKTASLPDVCRTADILVVAIGKAELVRGDWIKPGAVVIDCGINSVPDETKASGKRLVGDVCFAEASTVAGHVTPVPGGVGPMTVAQLMRNVMERVLK